MRILLAVCCIATLALAEPTEFSDSGIFSSTDYEDILNKLERLSVAYPDLAQVIDYGQSVEGRLLRMLVVKKTVPTRLRRRPTLLMTGSTHGNEYLNIEDRLPEEILKKARSFSEVSQFLDAGGAFVFVPIVNPDGFTNRTRTNANKVDLNRDWDLKQAKFKGFKQVESRSLAKQLALLHSGPEGLNYEITVDYHCCGGALLTPWAYKKGELPAADQIRYSAVTDLASDLLDISVGNTSSVLGYFPKGTSKDYYYSTYGARAFTYEGRANKENKLFNEHLSWWESMVSLLLGHNRGINFAKKSLDRLVLPRLAD